MQLRLRYIYIYKKKGFYKWLLSWLSFLLNRKITDPVLAWWVNFFGENDLHWSLCWKKEHKRWIILFFIFWVKKGRKGNSQFEENFKKKKKDFGLFCWLIETKSSSIIPSFCLLLKLLGFDESRSSSLHWNSCVVVRAFHRNLWIFLALCYCLFKLTIKMEA